MFKQTTMINTQCAETDRARSSE